MRKEIFVTLVLLAALASAPPAAHARQGGSPTDAEVEQVRGSIRALEQETPPAGLETQHRASLAALRLSLRDKLMAQKAAMEAYLARVRAALPADQAQSAEAAIREKDGEIAEATNALIAAAGGAPTPPPQRQTPPQRLVPQPPLTTPKLSVPPPTIDPSLTPLPAQPPQQPTQPQAGRTASGELDLAALALAGENALDTRDAAGAVASGSAAAQEGKNIPACDEVNNAGPNSRQFSEYESAVCGVIGVIRDQKAGSIDRDTGPIAPIPGATFAIGQNFMELQTIAAAKLIGRAVENVIAEAKHLTRDLGGSAGTREMGDAVAKRIAAA